MSRGALIACRFCALTVVAIVIAANVWAPPRAGAQLSEEEIRRREVSPDEAVLIKLSRDINTISSQARLSLARQQAMLHLLMQPTPGNVRTASILSLQAYRLARAAHEGMLYRKAGRKFGDPLVDLAEPQVREARFALDTIDKTLDAGQTRDPERIRRAIDTLNKAMTMLENALVLLP